MQTREQDLATRDRLATALVTHLIQEDGGGRADLPISHVDAAGQLSLWKVTVERVARLEFEAG
jgi:hypothetical protein